METLFSIACIHPLANRNRTNKGFTGYNWKGNPICKTLYWEALGFPRLDCDNKAHTSNTICAKPLSIISLDGIKTTKLKHFLKIALMENMYAIYGVEALL